MNKNLLILLKNKLMLVVSEIVKLEQAERTKPKKLKRLYDRGDELRQKLIKSYLENNKEVEELKSLINKLPV